jgi:hypothetical protein
MNDRDEGQIIAKQVEMALQAAESRKQAAAGIQPVADTPDTVTLARADYDALLRLCETLPTPGPGE